MKQMEKILCAAIWFDDKKKYEHQPKNIAQGYVVCGHRHNNCFMTVAIIQGHIESPKIPKVQGFLTSENNFVSRKKAMEIAIEAGQGGHYGKMELGEALFSEDLY